MPRVQGFPPIAARNATILILGSMPGEASLRARQYYAHPRNLFWRIIGEVLDVDLAAPYRQRTLALTRSGIALWDVLQSCHREGSLDSAIDDETLVANDFAAFFRGHPHIAKICFNGAKAEACFRRHVMHVMHVMPVMHAMPVMHVMPGLRMTALECRRLPSTSPANASIAFARKLDAWRAALRC